MIDKFNRRITIKDYNSSAVGVYGEVTKSEASSWVMWANIEQRSGSSSTIENQQVWSYDTKITVRYQASRLLHSNMLVIYEGNYYKINNLSVEKEGFKEFVILRCTKTDGAIT